MIPAAQKLALNVAIAMEKAKQESAAGPVNLMPTYMPTYREMALIDALDRVAEARDTLSGLHLRYIAIEAIAHWREALPESLKPLLNLQYTGTAPRAYAIREERRAIREEKNR